MAKVKIGNVKGPQGEQGPQGPTGATGATGQVDASTAIEFEENSSYANIESGESIATIFGKLKKIAGGILAGAGSTLLGANLTTNRVLLSNSDGKITASTITDTELAYLDGLTGNVQQNINLLNEKMYVSYTGVSIIASESSDANTKKITVSKDGFIQAICKTGADKGQPFVRLQINGLYVFEGHAENAAYRYLWTPLFPVKAGDVVIYTMANQTSSGERTIRLYGYR